MGLSTGLKICLNNHPFRKSPKHKCTQTRSTCGAPLQSAVHSARVGSPRPEGPAGGLQNPSLQSSSLCRQTGGCCPFLCYSASACLKSPLNQSVFASEVLNVPWHLTSSNYTMHVSVICSLLQSLPRAHVSGPFHKAHLEVVTV